MGQESRKPSPLLGLSIEAGTQIRYRILFSYQHLTEHLNFDFQVASSARFLATSVAYHGRGSARFQGATRIDPEEFRRIDLIRATSRSRGAQTTTLYGTSDCLDTLANFASCL